MNVQQSQDKVALNINLTDEEIEEMSKAKFKKIVDYKIENYALQQLNELKSKHSNSQYLQLTSFKTATYLLDDRFTKKESQMIFKLRSKTLNVEANFENQHTNFLCQTWQSFPESQSNLVKFT